MGLRDILIFTILIGSLPFILTRAYLGIYVWSWLGYMNPHKLAYGFAFDMPFAQIVGITTLISLAFSNDPKRIPVNSLIIVWVLFVGWMCITTTAAILPEYAVPQLSKVLKIQVVVFMTIILINSRERLKWLLWVIVISIGIFGVKGGIFTLVNGGGSRVYGPPGGFFFENNALAVATLMVLPLMYFVVKQFTNRFARVCGYGAIGVCVLSVLGSQSRGAIVAGVAVLIFFWLKSHRKVATAVVLVFAVAPLVAFMPQKWVDRKDTIIDDGLDSKRSVVEAAENFHYQFAHPDRDWLGFWPADQSAVGRINAWNFSINVANAKILGCGFECWGSKSFMQYAPIGDVYYAAHSIYFSVLAEHGWIGLAFYLGILFLAWRQANWLIRHCRGDPELQWYGDLARVIQVSFVAYGTGGAFLSLSYFDLPWHLIAILVISRTLVEQHREQTSTAPVAPDARPALA